MASSIDGNSLAQAFISARELDASQGEQLSAFATPAGAAAQAAPPATNFIEKTLTRVDGQPISNITHMEFGPDGLLYASSLTGTIYAYNIQKTSAGNYLATVVHQIDLLSQIPNHNDDGTLVPQVQGRYVLGFDVVGTASDPIIYVTSNDPRIDTIADSNSGILSMLRMDANQDWQKIDLVRGLTRSQHDHLLNGVEYFIDKNGAPALLVSVGGHTNAGAPSAPLGYLPEYVLSGAVLKVDLNAITAMTVKTDSYGQKYYFNLPTLDDPTRPGVNEGVDASVEIFGGHGGLNQAKYDPNGPVTFYATGLRNATEILETQNGNFLTFDNGGNPSWGNTVVIRTDQNGNQIATNLPEQGGSITTNQDQLHLILPGAYLGHPNPFRASGSAAGLYVQDGSGTPLPQLPSDFASVIPQSLENFREAFFLAEGTQDGALALSSKSTNGLAEYTFSGAFGGAIAGNIFAVRYGTQSMIRIELADPNGDGVPDSGVVAQEYSLGVGGPIDVLAPSTNDPFFGTLFVSGLVDNGSIRILEPGDGSGNVNKTDRDGDRVPDTIDAFPYDPNNGQHTVLAAGQTLFWNFESTTAERDLPGGIAGYRVGITGFMSNGHDLPETLSLDRFNPVAQGGDDVVLGGTANTILIGATPGGTAEGAINNQYHGFQAGFVPKADSFTMTVEVWNPFRTIPIANRSEQQKTGAALSCGNQDSFLALMIGKGFIELVYEEGGVQAARLRQNNPSIEHVDLTTYLTNLIFDVNVASGQVVARYQAQTLDGLVVGQFAPIQLYGDLLNALQGEHKVGGETSALAWTLLATSGSAAPFESNWGSVTLEGTTPKAVTGSAQVTVSGDSTFDTGSFTVTNTGSVDITRLVLTIDDTFVDDIFWNSEGGGDNGGVSKPFTVDSAGGTGVTNSNGVTVNPLPGGGFSTLIIDFPNFNPGETMTFSIDVDPRSAAGFGAGSPQGSISGLEMAGTVVTAFFADQTSASSKLVGTGANTSVAHVSAGLAPEIELTLAGLTNGERGFVSNPQQTLELRGAPNARVAVMIGAGDILPDDSTAPTLPPLGFNSIQGLEIRYVTLDATGFATTTINVIDPDPNDPDDGVVRIMAAVVDQNDQPAGRMGAGITVAAPHLITALNIGGGAYTAVESGINYIADPGPATGTITYRNLSGQSIGGTQDDSLYQTYGFGDFSYTLAVPAPGNYLVKLDLIEPFWQAAGSRLFDVALEGSVPTGLHNIDIYALAGGQFQALTLTQTVSVTDGTLDVDFNPLVDNSIVSAVAVYSVGGSPGNNPPVITSNGGGNTAAVSVAENTTAVTTVTATDPDAGQTLSYLIAGGADASKFTLNATTGVLAFVTAPNFEAPTDAGANNIYDITVQVSDGNGGIDTQALAVTVQNVTGATINGTAQAETLTGGGEDDVLNGLGGNDTLAGLGGPDILDGGTGTDTASYAASASAVTVSLAAGTASGGDAEGDTLIGIENLTGSGFDDTLEGNDANNVLNGGAGADTVSYEHAGAAVTVRLAITAAQNTGGAGTDTLSGFENLTGSAFDDALTGSTAANVLMGLGGADTLNGGAGADTLIGGAGNDILVGGSGADVLTGGLDADRFVFNALADSAPGTPDLVTDFVHGTDIFDLSAIDANTTSAGNQAFVFGGQNANVVAHSVTWFESGGNTIIQGDVNGNTTADFKITLTGINHNLSVSDFIL